MGSLSRPVARWLMLLVEEDVSRKSQEKVDVHLLNS